MTRLKEAAALDHFMDTSFYASVVDRASSSCSFHTHIQPAEALLYARQNVPDSNTQFHKLTMPFQSFSNNGVILRVNQFKNMNTAHRWKSLLCLLSKNVQVGMLPFSARPAICTTRNDMQGDELLRMS